MSGPLSPAQAVIGGAMIGIAATAFLALNGRIAGNSGMLHGLLPPQRGQALWRLLYLAGLVVGALGVSALRPSVEAASAASAASPLALVLGGVLVGIGTRLSGGCTSGHGVCGIGRRSPRSVVATLAFMGAGMAMVFVIRHLLGWRL